jgi:adenylate kinase/ribonuclease R
MATKKRRRNPAVWRKGPDKGKTVKTWGTMSKERRDAAIKAGRITFRGRTKTGKSVSKSASRLRRMRGEAGIAGRKAYMGPSKKKKAASKKRKATKGKKRSAASYRAAAKKAAATRKRNEAAKKRKKAAAARKRKRKPTKRRTTAKRKPTKRKSKSMATKKKRKKRKKGKRSHASYVAAGRKAARTRAANKRKRSAAAKRGSKRRGKGKTTRVTLRRGKSNRMARTKRGRKRRSKLVRSGYLSKRGSVNPGRRGRGYGYGLSKRKKRKKAKRGRRRGRRNPPTVMDCFTGLLTMKTLYTGAQGLVGMSLATMLPASVDRWTNGKVRNSGWTGVGLTLASTALATCAAGYVEKSMPGSKVFRGFARNVALGGVFISSIRLLGAALPAVARYLNLPSVSEGSSAALRAPGMEGLADWIGLSGMGQGGSHSKYAIPFSDIRGMGMASSNEALVAGESFARSVNQFEGMGALPGGMSYPGQYGGGGVGGWLETITPGAPLNPGSESF